VRRTIPLLLAFAVLLAGCGAPKTKPLSVADSVTVDGATAHAVSVFLAAGHTMSWNWTSTGKLRFDIHDQGNNTEHVVQEGLAGEGKLKAPAEGPYVLQWENRGNVSVALTYRFSGDALQ
jgi:hypothetical protein